MIAKYINESEKDSPQKNQNIKFNFLQEQYNKTTQKGGIQVLEVLVNIEVLGSDLEICLELLQCGSHTRIELEFLFFESEFHVKLLEIIRKLIIFIRR